MVHHRSKRYKGNDGHRSETKIDHGLCHDHRKLPHAKALYQTARYTADEKHDPGIAYPSEFKHGPDRRNLE